MIFIIEDDTDIAEILNTLVSKEGHDSRVMSCCEELKAAVSSVEPDLVIIDGTIPERELVGCLDEIEREGPYRVLLMTKLSYDSEAIDSCLGRQCVVGSIAKPFDFADLRRCVRRSLRKKI